MFWQTIVFPRIAIKTSPGALIIRETEKVLDEKVTLRTEEVPCPVTGVPHLRTVEVVEKIIETEVWSELKKKTSFSYNHTPTHIFIHIFIHKHFRRWQIEAFFLNFYAI